MIGLQTGGPKILATALIAAIAGGSLLLATSLSADAKRYAACRVAVDFARKVIPARVENIPWIVVPGPPKIGDGMSAQDLSRADWSLDRPSLGLSTMFFAASARSALTECRELRALLNDSGVLYGDEAAGRVRREEEIHPLPAFQPRALPLSIDLPVVSEDGREALIGLAVGYHTSMDMIQLMRLDKAGRWFMSDRRYFIGPIT